MQCGMPYIVQLTSIESSSDGRVVIKGYVLRVPELRHKCWIEQDEETIELDATGAVVAFPQSMHALPTTEGECRECVRMCDEMHIYLFKASDREQNHEFQNAIEFVKHVQRIYSRSAIFNIILAIRRLSGDSSHNRAYFMNQAMREFASEQGNIARQIDQFQSTE